MPRRLPLNLPKEKQLELCRIARIVNSLSREDRAYANQVIQDLKDGKGDATIAGFCRALSSMIGHVPIATMSVHINGVCSCDPK